MVNHGHELLSFRMRCLLEASYTWSSVWTSSQAPSTFAGSKAARHARRHINDVVVGPGLWQTIVWLGSKEQMWSVLLVKRGVSTFVSCLLHL